MAAPRSHAADAVTLRRDLQRLRAELRAQGVVDTAALEARVDALETELDGLQLEINHADPDAYNPDLPPLTAHDLDDEFSTDGTLTGNGWTLLDPGGHLTGSGISNGFGYLTMASTALGNGRMVAAYKDVPGVAEWALAAKMTMSSLSGGTIRYGLFVAEDLDANPTTANFHCNGVLQNTSVVSGTLSAYDAAYTAITTVSRVDRSVYLRGRITGTTTIAWDWCDDGIGMNRISSGAVGFTPVHVGFWARNASSGADLRLRVAWFRVFEATVDTLDLEPGGRKP